MATLVLVKHSLVTVDAALPSAQWRLNDEGRRLCGQLATLLRDHDLDLLVSSEEAKAVETAGLLAGDLAIETRTAPGLHEHRRPFVDMPAEFDRLMQRFFAEHDQRVFGEESAAEALVRFGSAVDDVMAAALGRNLGIVSHGTVISLYAAPMFGIGEGALWQRLQMPSFVVLDLEARRGLRIIDEVE